MTKLGKLGTNWALPSLEVCAQHGQYLTGESPVITFERREDIDEGKGVRRKRWLLLENIQRLAVIVQ